MLLDPNPSVFPAASASAWGEDSYGLWQAFEINGVRQVMRWIEPGEFIMGSPENEPERNDTEIQHKVTLTQGYWLAETACTQALWQTVSGENPSRFKDQPQHPVEQVSWDDTIAFIQTCNHILNRAITLRLPTEAEWEYACRAGTDTAFSWGNDINPDQANYDGNYPYHDGVKGENRKQTVAVDHFTPNPWGLYQMHGNVYEWCADWRGDYPNEQVFDPTGVSRGHERVLRGGCWVCRGRSLRSASRDAFSPVIRFYFIGLRLAGG